ncbi:MAG: IS1096 element passenger TnpR family protein, partial [Marinilabiliaceae bacterium]
MIYKFRIISNENEEFIREVAIDSGATFLDLHNFLIEELGYEDGQMTSFFITDKNWHKETEITLIDMTDEQIPGIKVMESTKLGELITEKKQRLLYVFDQFAE